MLGRNIFNKLLNGEILISDGATGTNLQTIGLPLGSAPEFWVLENPEAIIALEKQFVAAGADILLTCTFGTTRLRLQSSNLAENMGEINREAVAIARKAKGERDLIVAGSIGPTGSLLEPYGPLSAEDALAAFSEQAAIQTEAGVDMFVIETQYDINEARAAILGVRSATSDLPLVVSFSFDKGNRTMMGVSIEDVVRLVSEYQVDIVGINCGRDLESNFDLLQRLRSLTDMPIWFKPNAGLPKLDGHGKPVYAITPQMMGQAAISWVKAGANIIGGCCGTSPAHLSEIARNVRSLYNF